MDELKNELEKEGRDVVEGPSHGTDDAEPQRRRQSTRKVVKDAVSSKAADIDMVAADMTVKQLQAALSAHHLEPPKGAKKAALVKMLDTARIDRAAGSQAAAATRKKKVPPRLGGQKRKNESSTLAPSTNKRKKASKRGATAEAAEEEPSTRVDEEQNDADPAVVAGEMAATKARELDMSVLMKACEVRGLDEWGPRDQL